MLLGPIPQAHAQTFTVNVIGEDADDANTGDGVCDTDSTTTGQQCTLRAAISEANAHAGPDTIVLPAGTIALTLEGANEDGNVSGDLDITDDLTIDGAPLGASGVPVTIVQSGATSSTAHDRLFDIHGWTEAVTVVLNRLTIWNGKAPQHGGGIQNSGTLTLNDCIVMENKAGDGFVGGAASGQGWSGGGIASWGDLTLNRCIVLANKAGDGAYAADQGGGGAGGGIYSRSKLTINRSAVSFNKAGQGGGSDSDRGGSGGNGGGISHTGGGVLTVSDSTLANNQAGQGGRGGGGAADGDRGDGGGIFCIGLVTLRGSLVSGNTARYGAGLRAGGGSGGELTLENSTVSGNNADGYGGGILSYNVLRLVHCTVADNEAGLAADSPKSGGGLSLRDTTYLTNTIVAGNEASGFSPDWDCTTGTIVSQGYNIIEDTDGCTWSPLAGDLGGVDPMLGPLGHNGGPSRTHPLLAGSQAIDHIPVGTNGCQAGVSRDQRGYARAGGTGLGGTACDTGAYEYGSGPVVMFSASAYQVAEDAASAQIPVNLADISSDTVTVDYNTVDDTAIAGEDYTATAGTLTFEPGVTSQTFSVPILDDGNQEGPKTLTLSLSNPVNAAVGAPAQATLTILDDDTSILIYLPLVLREF
jgi:hypothetical protein